MKPATHYDFRQPRTEERRDWRSPSRRKEDIAVMLAVENLKVLRDIGAPIEQVYQQIDYVHDLLDQIMTKHRPQQDDASATRMDAADEQPNAA